MNLRNFRLFPRGESAAVIWLVFLIIPILYKFPYNDLESITSIGLIIIFVICYRNSYFHDKNMKLWITLQYVISILYCYIFSYSYLFMYPAWIIGFQITRKKSFYKWYITLIICYCLSTILIFSRFKGNLLQIEAALNLVFIIYTIAAPIGARAIKRQNDLKLQMFQSAKRLEVIIKQEERMRISRDLHDTLGQSLSIMTLKAELARKLIDKDIKKSKKELVEIENLSRGTLQSVREIVSSMRKVLIVEELVEIDKSLRAAKIIFKTSGEEILDKIKPAVQNTISFCLQECTTNVIRHSEASICSIFIEKKEEEYIFKIIDDGKGMKEVKKGNGLFGLYERVKTLNGQVKINNNYGVIIIIKFPAKILEVCND